MHRDLPPAWRVLQLGDFVVKHENWDPREQPDKPFHYVDVSAVSSSSLTIESPQVIIGADAPSRARRVIKSGDTLFATVRPSLRRVAQVPPELDGQLCSTAFTVIRPDPAVADPDFVFFAVATRDFVAQVSKNQRGSGYPAVRDGDVLKQPIPVPPLPEQRAIADVLHTVRRARDATEQVIDAARELKRSLMPYLFTKGPRHIAGAQTDLKEADWGEVPSAWRIVSTRTLVAETQSGDWGLQEPEQSLVEVHVLRGTDFPRAASGLLGETPIRYVNERSLAKRRLQEHDVLVEMSGGSANQATGRIMEVPAQLLESAERPLIFSNFVKRLKIGDGIDPTFLRRHWEFLYECGYTRTYERRTTGIRNFKLNDFLEQVPMVVPPGEDQRRIKTSLDSVDSKVDAEEQRRNALDTLFKSLLHDLMTARVRVPLDDQAEVRRDVAGI
jgi:type I restriction enzyme S subunit